MWVVLFAVLVLVVLDVVSSRSGYTDIEHVGRWCSSCSPGNVATVTFVDGDQEIQATTEAGEKISAQWLNGQGIQMLDLVQQEVENGTISGSYDVKVPKPSLLWSFLSSIFPILLVVLFFLFMMNSLQGGGGRVMQFAKSKAKLVSKDTPKTTFADVAGCDEAIEELGEIKEFLQQPAKFQAVGAKIPKGVLLYGPPGTGKTLLARAVAGEASVPFYSISGSDFVEMFVGVGASRVRDLFEQAKENAPAIVFIDEIDAVGRHRGAGIGGGHDEREQTLNQLLVEMDGFDVRGGVILIAATNRPDVLDPALLRPGRFDRMIGVDGPNMQGRHKILQVHSRGKPIAAGVDLLAVARRTPGFTGADLANVLNEAALLTARQNRKLIDDALARRGDRPGQHGSAAALAHHERAGEADDGLPRGRPCAGGGCAAGHRPGGEDHHPAARPRARLHAGAAGERQVVGLAQRPAQPARLRARRARGRAADLPRPDDGVVERHREGHQRRRQDGDELRHERAHRCRQARRGQRRAVPRRDFGHTRNYSEEIAAIIDEEISALMTNAHQEAFDILVRNRDVLDSLVTQLLERETIDRNGLEDIFAAVVDERRVRPAWTGSDNRVPSRIPPVKVPAAGRRAVPSPQR